MGRDSAALSVKARQGLSDLVMGQVISLRGKDAGRDRYGRAMGQGVNAAGQWLQGLLIDQGLTRVMHGELAHRGIGGRMSFRRNGRIYTRMLGFASIRSPEEKDTIYYMPGA
jgi:endonuclease YncB( thermonuclease family)